MRIAMIGSRGLLSDYSGIETLLRELCPRLIDRGHSVTVFGDAFGRRAVNGVDVEPVPALHTKHLETLSRSMFSALRVGKGRFDIAHYHDAGPAIFAKLSRFRGVPSILTMHSQDWRRDKWSRLSKRAIRGIETLAVAGVDRITVVSRALQHYILDSYGLRSTFLPNVIDLDAPVRPTDFSRSLALEPRKFILFAARLSPEKGAHELIDAFKTLETDLKLVIAGDSSYELRYAEALRISAAGSEIVFTGHLNKQALRELYSNAYLFVLPSHIEGRSMALLEALALQAAVLVSDLPENIELIGDMGTVFESGNVEDLAEKLQWLVDRPINVESQRKLAQDALRTQKSWDEVVSGYERIYREATGRRN